MLNGRQLVKTRKKKKKIAKKDKGQLKREQNVRPWATEN